MLLSMLPSARWPPPDRCHWQGLFVAIFLAIFAYSSYEMLQNYVARSAGKLRTRACAIVARMLLAKDCANFRDYPLQEFLNRVKHIASGEYVNFRRSDPSASGPRLTLDGGVTVAKKKAAKKVAKKCGEEGCQEKGGQEEGREEGHVLLQVIA